MHVVLDGCRGGSIDLEAVAGGKAHGAEQCRGVDGEHRVGIVDGADDFVAQVVQTAMIVDDGIVLEVVVDAVDRQVARIGIIEQVLTEGAIGGICRNERLTLEFLTDAPDRHHVRPILIGIMRLGNVATTRLRDGDIEACQLLLHLLGRGIGGEVEIVDGCTQDGVAHSTAVDVGLVAQFVESCHHILVVVGIPHDAGVEHR